MNKKMPAPKGRGLARLAGATAKRASGGKTKTIIAVLLLLSFCVPGLASAENKLSFGSSTRQASGVLDGKKKKYKVPLDASVYQTLFNLPSYTCGELGYTTDADQSACYNYIFFDRADQKAALAPLVNWIKKKIKKSGDGARVAASMVQNIPYDYNKSTGTEVVPSGRGHGSRYPYEVFYENGGICGEKARLIVYLLKELGYGTGLITFTSPSLHEVAGVKCPAAYDFQDTGYCFIDPNVRHMITFAGSYKDSTPYRVVPIADGKTLNTKKDYQDAQGWWKVLLEGTSSNKNYKLYKKLVKKYGL